MNPYLLNSLAKDDPRFGSLDGLMKDFQAQGLQYTPSGRESTNIEDRRNDTVFDFWKANAVANLHKIFGIK